MSDLVRDNIALADSILASFGLQAKVLHYRWVSGNLWAERKYASGPKSLKGVVSFKIKMFRTTEGEERTSSMTLTFTKPLAIDLRDKFEIHIGSQPPRSSEILSIEGAMDPLTGLPYAPVVYLA